DLCVWCSGPRTSSRRRPRAAGLQLRSHAAPSRRDRNQSRPRSTRHSPLGSGRLAWRQSPAGPEQRLTRATAAARTRTQRPGKHLAVHAPELVVKPDFQILRRYRRPLLLRLEHTHRTTLEDHVHRPTRLGSSQSLNLRIGITRLRRVLAKLDDRLPGRLTGLGLVRLGRKANPLLTARVPVIGAVAQHEPHAREFEVGEASQRVLFVGAEARAADHLATLKMLARRAR